MKISEAVPYKDVMNIHQISKHMAIHLAKLYSQDRNIGVWPVIQKWNPA